MSERTKQVTWKDPSPGMAAVKEMSGLDYLRAIIAGTLPAAPIADLMGFSAVAVEEGKARFEVQPQECHYNPIGTVHGGLAATVMDSALGCAVHSTLPAGAGYTTLELHINYVRAVTRETSKLTCSSEVVHVGGRLATAQARLVDAAGTLYAHGTTTCMIFRPSGA